MHKMIIESQMLHACYFPKVKGLHHTVFQNSTHVELAHCILKAFSCKGSLCQTAEIDEITSLNLDFVILNHFEINNE